MVLHQKVTNKENSRNYSETIAPRLLFDRGPERRQAWHIVPCQILGRERRTALEETLPPSPALLLEPSGF